MPRHTTLATCIKSWKYWKCEDIKFIKKQEKWLHQKYEKNIKYIENITKTQKKIIKNLQKFWENFENMP